MAEAFAKMQLKDFVGPDHIDLAIAVMVRSFVDAQKKSVKDQLRRVCRFASPLAHTLVFRLFKCKELLLEIRQVYYC
jgi:hypothetical protein